MRIDAYTPASGAGEVRFPNGAASFFDDYGASGGYGCDPRDTLLTLAAAAASVRLAYEPAPPPLPKGEAVDLARRFAPQTSRRPAMRDLRRALEACDDLGWSRDRMRVYDAAVYNALADQGAFFRSMTLDPSSLLGVAS